MSIYDAVKLDRPVLFSPYINNGYSCAVEDEQPFTMCADDVKPFIDELAELSQLDIIEDTRQSLVQRHDGTLLQTAFPVLADFKAIIVEMKTAPKKLIELVNIWQASGANEIVIDFEEKPRTF
ncbi:hypothetical protein [Psychrobacter sp. UBA3480]|uniref:hypothetical protein n=2 Tax=Psychrobacter TaxID=497 RepID=UPI0025EB26A7|nr:hypothetical protein [Psychrobacter sp. UBA3480]